MKPLIFQWQWLIPYGDDWHSYWKWPSRNSEFSPLKTVICHSYVNLPEGKLELYPMAPNTFETVFGLVFLGPTQRVVGALGIILITTSGCQYQWRRIGPWKWTYQWCSRDFSDENKHVCIWACNCWSQVGMIDLWFNIQWFNQKDNIDLMSMGDIEGQWT